MNGNESTKDCVFCSISRGETPAFIIYQDGDMVIFRDINPQAPIHWLAIPRTHSTSIADIEDFGLAGRILDRLTKTAAEQKINDYRLVINQGPQAGQTVFHLHIHLLAGRQMQWPPG